MLVAFLQQNASGGPLANHCETPAEGFLEQPLMLIQFPQFKPGISIRRKQ